MAFELELQSIENSHTREYMKEVVSDYNNGNYRSSVILLYVVVMSDIVEKLGSLSRAYGNKAAKSILEDLKKKRLYDASRENFLVDETEKRLPSMLLPEANATIKSIKEWRNVSAHPSLLDDSPEPLGRPSQEMVVGLIRDAIKYILSQSADLSTKSFSPFLDEIASIEDAFPEDEPLRDYLNKRYFSKFNETSYNYFVEHLFKTVFGGNSPEAEKYRAMNYRVLTMLIDNKRDRSISYLIQTDTFKEIRIVDDSIVPLLMQFFRRYPESFVSAPEFSSKLIEDKTADDSSLKLDNYFLDSNDLATHIEKTIDTTDPEVSLYKVINEVDWTDERVNDIKQQLKQTGDMELFNKLSILVYGYSNTYRTADVRFELFVDPGLDHFTEEQFGLLFKLAGENSQCSNRWRASNDHKKVFAAFTRRFDQTLTLQDLKAQWPSFAYSI